MLFFWKKIPPRWYSLKEHFCLFFSVRPKLTSAFLKLVFQHRSTAVNAFGTVQMGWFGDVFAMTPALAAWKAAAVPPAGKVPPCWPYQPAQAALEGAGGGSGAGNVCAHSAAYLGSGLGTCAVVFHVKNRKCNFFSAALLLGVKRRSRRAFKWCSWT